MHSDSEVHIELYMVCKDRINNIIKNVWEFQCWFTNKGSGLWNIQWAKYDNYSGIVQDMR